MKALRCGFHSSVFVLIYCMSFMFSCKENPAETDTYPPMIVITYPPESSTLTEPASVKTVANDNKGVVEIDFFVDNNLVFKSFNAPFEFIWNVGFWADGKRHTVFAKGIDAAGNIGTSQIVTVTIATSAMAFPELTSPTGNQFLDTTTIDLQWRPLIAAKQYEIQLAMKEDFSSLVSSTTTTDTVLLISNLTYARYFWRVRAIGPNGNNSLWSTAGSFTRLLAPPTGISPTKGFFAEGSQTSFVWSKVRKSLQYELAVASDSSFSNSIFTMTTADTLAKVSSLPTNPRLYWHVRSIAPDGTPCPWSSVFLFSKFNSFTKTFRGYVINAIQQAADGGFILAGSTAVNSNGSSDGFMTRLDGKGNLVWLKTYGGIDEDAFLSVRQTNDGGFLATGYKNQTSQGTQIAWVVKTDDRGELVWEKNYGPKNCRFTSIAIMRDGNYIFCGQQESPSYIGHWWLGWVVKLGSSGDTLWTKLPDVDFFSSIEATSDGGAVLAGSRENGKFRQGGAVFQKINSQGDILWNQTIYNGYGEKISELTDGSCIALYIGSTLYRAERLDANGSILWQMYWDYVPGIFWMQLLSSGDWIYCGTINGSGLLVDYNPSGVLQWTASVPLTGFRVIPCTDDGFFLAGYFSNGDYGVLKTDSRGDYTH